MRIKQTNNKNKQNKQIPKQQTNKQTFSGQAEAIVRSAAAATTGQNDDFVDDPVFEEFLCAGGTSSNVGTMGRGNPGWLSSQLSYLSLSTYFDCCLIKRLDR